MKINISIDFEDEKHYFRTLGIPFEGKLIQDFYARTAGRFLEIFDKLGVKATFFIIGEDVDPNIATLREIVSQGHEIGNHTYYHPFAMSSLPEAKQHDEIQKAHEKIQSALGVQPQCYRAPCYDISLPNINFLSSLGYRCDSSFYPSRLAFYQKLIYKILTKRPVRMGPDDVHLAPLFPYYVNLDAGEYYVPNRNGATFLEVPIPHFSALEMPLYSTPQYVLGKDFIKWGARSLINKKIHFTYELHSIDMASIEEDEVNKSLKTIPQMRVALKKKTDDLKEILKIFKNEAQIVPIVNLL